MRATLLASIPQDNGKRINCGGYYVTIGDDVCDCGEPATKAVQGETDSAGFEVMFFCDKCLAECNESEKQHLEALDVEDRAGFFVVSECNNADNGVVYYLATKSFRAATAYYRKIERQAEPRAGLYPNQGIIVLDNEADFEAKVARHNRAVEYERHQGAEAGY